ncbi:MAG: right-handed parallel beta-helix repeat-containing protein [Phycisphaerae bacterium]|nr:right-handed parallel beta-helix repeat-containing protein [Planctomycetia bacterium]MCL4719125.1 right-handed parallel beta-helix repeat-containing protein [Phycisphaerae bacterium]
MIAFVLGLAVLGVASGSMNDARPAAQDVETVKLATGGQRITKSVKVAPGTYEVPDTTGAGAVLIEGEGLTVDFGGATLSGAASGVAPDQFTGTGVVIRGKKITIRNLKVRGYKVGIHARECDGLTLEDTDISDNYRKRLLSTPEREDGSDWIFPHHNDGREWMTNYGAGLYVERAAGVTLRRIRARDGQNGIILDRVVDSAVYDNDCSFLSGWGLAMWRSSGNVIARNAFDFCVRGYSHGVYNRGQDSAGILMFEQNHRNLIAENSCTHGGDGFFGFGGRDALGETWLEREIERLRKEKGEAGATDAPPVPSEVIEGHRRLGNNDNLLFANDFSYAPAHGIEMTFSFGNKFINNRLVGNAICGVWGGYSQDTLIEGNTFEDNGEMGYGAERGGVNIEHGRGNRILNNTFNRNKCGVFLWDDDDAHLLRTPWAKANHVGSRDNVIALNTFADNDPAIQLRRTVNTQLAENKATGGRILDHDEGSDIRITAADALPAQPSIALAPLPGETRPVGARKHLAGRQHIVMTEWGPYDYEGCLLVPGTVAASGASAHVQVLGPKGAFRVQGVSGDVKATPSEGTLPGRIAIEAAREGFVPFKVSVEVKTGEDAGTTLTASGSLLNAKWTVSFFRWDPASDPRDSEDNWKKIVAQPPVETQALAGLDFKWHGGAVSEKVGQDHFATVARTTIELPASPSGKWRIRTVSDDGVRVFVDDKPVLSNWTWHGPTEDVVEFELAPGRHEFRVEHFEINGWAVLQFRLEPV